MLSLIGAISLAYFIGVAAVYMTGRALELGRRQSLYSGFIWPLSVGYAIWEKLK